MEEKKKKCSSHNNLLNGAFGMNVTKVVKRRTEFLNNILYLGDLGMEVLHVLAKHLSKLAKDFFVPGVILQVNLGLDLLPETNNQLVKSKCKKVFNCGRCSSK